MHRQYYGRWRNGPLTKAQQHVAEYNALCRRLGPVVGDIKKIFFDMEADILGVLLAEYWKSYGDNAYQYVLKTYYQWENGSVKMSGQTATRLIKLVPKHLDVGQRYDLVKNLCNHHLPHQSRRSVHIRVDQKEKGIKELNRYIAEFSSIESIKYLPEDVVEDFNWLIDPDITIIRKMLSIYDKEITP